jgi:hypothetical protein
MVSKNIIQKTFDELLIGKCNSSDKAQARGEGAVRVNHRNDYEINYPDGTHIRFDKKTHELIELDIDGEHYTYLGQGNTDKLSESQGKTLESSKGFKGKWINDVYYDMEDNLVIESEPFEESNGFDFATHYVNQFASIDGMMLNSMLWKGESLRNSAREGYPGIIFNKNAHDYFVELERKVRCDVDNILAVRYTNNRHPHTVVDEEKEFYTAKGHTSYTVGGDSERINDTFYDEDGWTIITPIRKGSNVRGLFMGNLIPFTRGYGSDWEGELNLPPGTKFGRDLIDWDNQIIIQHVESQRGV